MMFTCRQTELANRLLIRTSTVFTIVMMLLTAVSVSAQDLIVVKGRVLDEETDKPLPYASVFLNNSTFGAVADENGEFEFYTKPGNYDLIVNFFSYQPIIFPVEFTKESAKKFVFKMRPLEYDLEEVSVESTRDKIWYKNFEVFKSTFLGSSINASKCEILNPEVLIIDFNQKTKTMKVRARDVLKIRNSGLGYDIDYLLDTYEYNVGLGRVYFQGYPRFLEMKGRSGKKSKWSKARRKAYLGSPTHLFTSLVAGNSAAEGFSMIKIIRKLNPNRPTELEVKEARSKLKSARISGVTISPNSDASSVMARSREPKFIQYTNNQPLTSDSLIVREGDKIYLDFEDHIQIIYDKEPSELAFTGSISSKKTQKSVMSLTGTKTEILENGMMLDPFAILFEGYMGWEKLGDMLPVDYKLSDGTTKKGNND
ncbi:MAG: carboxypeptidase-like regulatory domain-containing protein [Bacteroidota bacterium]